MNSEPTTGPEQAGPVGLPPAVRLDAAIDLRVLAGGRILLGGAPFTIMRLSAAGAKATRRWFRGDEVSPAASHQALARRLLDSGMAHPRWGARPSVSDDLTVVIPVKDDQSGLDETLAALVGSGPDSNGASPPRIVVIDDGSSNPVTCSIDGITLLRNPTASGPGQARQIGLTEVATPLVAFVDAGVQVAAADLAMLCQEFEDPYSVAAAPRIRSTPSSHLVGRYDERRSPLDLGPSLSAVGPGRSVPYVPTACLVARTSAVRDAGGFDPGLRYGEDVDLVWRMSAAGAVRYRPDVEASHPPRSSLSEMVKQRASYGSAAAPLAERHGEAVAPAKLSGWSVLVTLLLLAGHPAKAAVAWGWTARALRPKIEPMPEATVEAALLTGRGHWYGGLSLLTAVARTWMPLVVLCGLLVPSQRPRLAKIVAAAFCRRLLDGPRAPDQAAVDLLVGTVDDLSYCAGVWQGVLESRSGAALKPSISSWPTPGAASAAE